MTTTITLELPDWLVEDLNAFPGIPELSPAMRAKLYVLLFQRGVLELHEAGSLQNLQLITMQKVLELRP
jgi:hypothetical protein